jgi:hypothetical protein
MDTTEPEPTEEQVQRAVDFLVREEQWREDEDVCLTVSEWLDLQARAGVITPTGEQRDGLPLYRVTRLTHLVAERMVDLARRGHHR